MQCRIHSVETCGTLDGPGIRYIAFLQGCPLRCQYCHNPDTWDPSSGNLLTASEIVEDVKKYKSYIQASNGGFTASGGEPLLQSKFILELFKLLKDEGVHTAIDTSGYIYNDSVKEALEYTDLVLLDIKSINRDVFENITAVKIDNTLKLMDYLQSINLPVWIRNVIVPDLSDNLDDIDQLGKYLSGFSNIDRVELLPFHKLGEFKWEQLGLSYNLSETKPPSHELMQTAKDIISSYKLPLQ